MKFRNKLAALYAVVTASAVTNVALAGGGGPDYSAITDAIDFEDVSALILPAAGALIGLYVLIKGVRIVIGFVKGG